MDTFFRIQIKCANSNKYQCQYRRLKAEDILILTRKKIISENNFQIEGKIIHKIELREYKLNSHTNEENYSIMLYVNTDAGETEVDYLGKSTKDKQTFEESFNFLCNYNGISSTLNRIIIEINNNTI